MISYRTKSAYDDKFGRGTKNGVEYGKGAEWDVKSYLEYQGEVRHRGRSERDEWIILLIRVGSTLLLLSLRYSRRFAPRSASPANLSPPFGLASLILPKKFLDRFDPITYIKLTEQMDSHDVGRGRGGVDAAMSLVKMPVCVMGIDSDVLYPIEQQRDMYKRLTESKDKEFIEVKSDAGHDGFLLEQYQVGRGIQEFLNRID